MDPLTALSTASAVVQLVDFGRRILDDTHELYTQGRLVTLQELKTTTQDLVHVNHLLAHRPQPGDNAASPISDAEQALDQLAADCSEAAKELIACLQSLDADVGIGRWRSFCQAVRSRWTLRQIQDMEARIRVFREQLTIRVLAVLNTRTALQVTRQEERFDRLDQSHADVVDVVAINRQRLESTLRTDVSGLAQDIAQGEAQAQTRHDEVIAAILHLQDGSAKVLTGGLVERPSHLPAHETIMTLQKPVLNHVDFRVQDFGVVQSKVLDCLHFRQIDHRYDTVLDAHRDTYQWIYQSPEIDGKPWSNFVQWLEQGHGCYWVNGKAGSGKSTLMKFIHSHPRTARSLAVWAGNHELVRSTFFLSNLGHWLQKSPAGLIRTLLHDALNRHRHLIPLVVPDLCRAAAKLEPTERLSEPTFAELSKAFQNLIRSDSANLRICFLIDGVDECEGDYSEILNLVASASQSRQIKIIVSSRPIPPCVAAFSGSASLRLQDLTYDDIGLYVEDKLLQELQRRIGEHAPALVLEIVEKSSGVFLWIVLVVRSLILGVQSMDRIDDLQRRVDELPSDLTELYSHMLQRIDPLYKTQAWELFQLVLNSVRADGGREPTTLQLYFADQGPLVATTAPIRTIPTADESRLVEEMDGRIRSRCCGLLEIRDQKYSRGIMSTIHRPTVAFLHRTVFEFLTEQIDSKDWLGRAQGNPDFDAHLSLASSCLLLAKSLPREWTENPDSLQWQSMQACLHHCSMIEQQHAITTDLLDELNRTIPHQLAHLLARPWSPEGKHGIKRFWAAAPPFGERLPSDSFLSLTVTWGLSFYLQDELDRNENDTRRREDLLRLAVRSFVLMWTDLSSPSHPFSSSGPARMMGYAGIISILLESGVSPNGGTSDPNGSSPWECLLQHFNDLLLHHRHTFLQNASQEGGYTRTFLDLLVVMVVSAAAPNASVIWKTKSYRGVEHVVEFRRSALRIIELLPSDEAADFPPSRLRSAVSINHQPIAQYRTRLIRMLRDRGARLEEWTSAGSSGGAENRPASKEDAPLIGSQTTKKRPWKRMVRAFRNLKVE
ncbi:uncharacterized protein BDW47DRAFT_125696 [Aspergillus candidus]|uniref:Uncharacterized protein n=1 Tax=Aspergillus candidus TaxID=41067 RepID=A0A2I2FBL4_ASPCN|nr:hypothetical protein BDW47DRAFT_125696 [Aspergillus candidus]PLB37993.1 hypothetical protein BDW47DRAFT_125696 [Aspergillus candidus]